MNETIREKRIRFFLLAFFISLTAAAFLYKYKESLIHNPDKGPLAFVYHESNNVQDAPIVFLYEYISNKHVITFYKVDRTDQYKFISLSTKEVDHAPAAVTCDQSKEGIWLEIKGKWQYFNSRLERVNRDSVKRCKNLSEDISYAMKKYENQTIIRIDSQKIILEGKEIPTGVLPLSHDRKLWLITTESGVKIVTNETK